MTTRPAEINGRATDHNPGSVPSGPYVASLAQWLSGALLLAISVAAGLTFFSDGTLSGTAAMNGSARGTALVFLVVTTPAMVAGMILAGRGSVRAIVVWLGALFVTVYNAQMFLYATPFNQLFLVYLAVLALSIWAIVALLSSGTVGRLAAAADSTMPVRLVAGYVVAIAVFNALLWLKSIIPAVLSDAPTSVLAGTGLTTNPVYVQDLAIWLPLAIVGACWLWRRRSWGYPIVGGVLVLWVIESMSVAADQWFGSQADPASTVVSATMVPAFAVLALIGLVPLAMFLRHIDSGRREMSDDTPVLAA
jgi:hypothetical protein